MMPERIEKTVLATRDIEELAAFYLAEAGIEIALRFVAQAEHAFAQLARMPQIGALLGFQHSIFADIRRWHVHGFPRLLVLYAPLPDGIQIIRVLDGARDIHSLFHDIGFPQA